MMVLAKRRREPFRHPNTVSFHYHEGFGVEDGNPAVYNIAKSLLKEKEVQKLNISYEEFIGELTKTLSKGDIKKSLDPVNSIDSIPEWKAISDCIKLSNYKFIEVSHGIKCWMADDTASEKPEYIAALQKVKKIGK